MADTLLIVLIFSSIFTSLVDSCIIPTTTNFIINSNTFTEIIDHNMNYISQSIIITPNYMSIIIPDSL